MQFMGRACRATDLRPVRTCNKQHDKPGQAGQMRRVAVDADHDSQLIHYQLHVIYAHTYICMYMVYICICIVRLNSPGAIAFYRWPALIKYQRNLLFKLSLSANKGARCTRRSSAVCVIERRIPNRAARGRTHNKFDSPSLCLSLSLKCTQISLTHTQTHTHLHGRNSHIACYQKCIWHYKCNLYTSMPRGFAIFPAN